MQRLVRSMLYEDFAWSGLLFHVDIRDETITADSFRYVDAKHKAVLPQAADTGTSAAA